MSLESLNRRIKTTTDLGEIVSTLKMLSSVSVGQYEKALQSLSQYAQNFGYYYWFRQWNGWTF